MPEIFRYNFFFPFIVKHKRSPSTSFKQKKILNETFFIKFNKSETTSLSFDINEKSLLHVFCFRAFKALKASFQLMFRLDWRCVWGKGRGMSSHFWLDWNGNLNKNSLVSKNTTTPFSSLPSTQYVASSSPILPLCQISTSYW